MFAAKVNGAKDGYIEGSVNLPTDFFANIDQVPADKDAKIIVTCASGHRGAMIMMALRLMGYTDVSNRLVGSARGNLPVGLWRVSSPRWQNFSPPCPCRCRLLQHQNDKLNEMLVENPPFIVDVRTF